MYKKTLTIVSLERRLTSLFINVGIDFSWMKCSKKWIIRLTS